MLPPCWCLCGQAHSCYFLKMKGFSCDENSVSPIIFLDLTLKDNLSPGACPHLFPCFRVTIFSTTKRVFFPPYPDDQIFPLFLSSSVRLAQLFFSDAFSATFFARMAFLLPPRRCWKTQFHALIAPPFSFYRRSRLGVFAP